MKILYLYDQKIKTKDAWRIAEEFNLWMEEHAGITPTNFFEPQNFYNYPTFIDSDGDVRPSDKWLRTLAADVHQRYSGEGTDHIVIWVHEDNWKSGKIWGTAFANMYSGYQVTYCRWDKDNPANTFGTLWHEIHHTFDSFIETYQGVQIEGLVGVTDWDKEITHGASPHWKYIRYQENAASLEAISTLLKAAYAKRHAVYTRKVGLLEQILVLLRQLFILKTTQR